MVDVTDNWPAWLEDASGKRTPIHGVCSLGRAESNEVTLHDDTVSRRHAVIQPQGDQEYWLVDFGSRNGSYVNGQRVAQPTRLHDGATVAIGASQYVFRQSKSVGAAPSAMVTSDETVINVRWATCWLLVADIIDSTKLIAELPADTLPLVTGQWLAQCKEVIEMHGGHINQFLGDGFFAFWHDHERMGSEMDKTHQDLCLLQAEGRPAFRFVTHLGAVMFGGRVGGRRGEDLRQRSALRLPDGKAGRFAARTTSAQRACQEALTQHSEGEGRRTPLAARLRRSVRLLRVLAGRLGKQSVARPACPRARL